MRPSAACGWTRSNWCAPPQGCLEFREVLAQRALLAGMRLSAADIQVTNGCTEALNLALRAVANPGDTIAVESPTFYGLLQTLESLGLKALEIPTSPRTGISVGAVELALRNTPGIKAVVVVPYLQNPTGSIMPAAHKQALLRLCQQQDVALIEDDTYGALVDDAVLREEPLRAIKSWDDSGHVMHCASLHKSLAPGLRLGWVSAGRWQARVEMLKFAASRSNERLAQMAVASFIGSAAYDRYLRRLRGPGEPELPDRAGGGTLLPAGHAADGAARRSIAVGGAARRGVVHGAFPCRAGGKPGDRAGHHLLQLGAF